MTEYIDKQAVIDEIEEWYDLYPDSDTTREALSLLKKAIKKISPEDVRPAVRGEWINTDAFDKESNVKCSECEMEFDYIDGICYLCAGHRLPNFCPNCGADMRSGDAE